MALGMYGYEHLGKEILCFFSLLHVLPRPVKNGRSRSKFWSIQRWSIINRGEDGGLG